MTPDLTTWRCVGRCFVRADRNRRAHVEVNRNTGGWMLVTEPIGIVVASGQRKHITAAKAEATRALSLYLRRSA